MYRIALAGLLTASLWGCTSTRQVGQQPDGSAVLPTGQSVRPVGDVIELDGRPIDFTVTGNEIVVKDQRGFIVLNRKSLKVLQKVTVPGGTSHLGIASTKTGSIYITDAGSGLHEFVKKGGSYVPKRVIKLPQPAIGGAVYPCGLAIDADDKTAYVAASRANAIYAVNLVRGEVSQRIPVDIAPYSVLLDSRSQTLFASCWGGRKPNEGTPVQSSSGTDVAVDKRGVAKSATVVSVSLVKREIRWKADVGLQPTAMAHDDSTRELFVACANADEVAVIDGKGTVRRRINTKPDKSLLFGSMPNAMSLSRDRKTIYVANGGNNNIAVIDRANGRIRGLIPTGWYPSAVQEIGGELLIANAKGIGSRAIRQDNSFSVYGFTGSMQRIKLPSSAQLKRWTDQAKEDALVPQTLASLERTATAKAPPTPIPARLGDPSTIKHVVYILKENRTYDQVFGAIGRGNSEPSLCIFGRDVTPNHHALADKYVLLDNFYCNGVLSADGHAWSMEGNATTYFERSFGGWTRSYPFGDDPLAVSTTGFIWDHVLAHGLTFKNYGEFNYAETQPKQSWKQLWEAWRRGERPPFSQKIGISRLAGYSHPTYPGWNMGIPDQIRADIFIEDLKSMQQFPNFTIIYLPQDHGSGMTPGEPTPRACMADNDLAVGRIVDALSKSKWWKEMAVFVTEDDPQNGFDHVDGHRTLCLVASPFVKRGAVVSEFYNQTSILHTMCRILGIPPLNSMVAMSPIMFDCFTSKPDGSTFNHVPNKIALDELNGPRDEVSEELRQWVDLSLRQNFKLVDAGDEDAMNRIIWHSVNGTRDYPAEWAGAHGRGLEGMGLKRDLLSMDDD